MRTVLCPCGKTYKKGETCTNCQRGKKQQLKKTSARGYGYDWRTLSESIRKDRPICEDCLLSGKITPSSECHHKVKIRDDERLRLDPDNILSLCSECHRIRTERGE